MVLRRSLFAAALAALVSLPATALAQRGSATTQVGAAVGAEFGDLDGVALRGDVVVPLQQLDRQTTLSFVGLAGLTLFSEGDVDATVFKLVPAARLSLDLAPQFTVYGDAGLGLYFADVDFGPFGDDSEVGLVMRFAAGGLVAITPTVKVGAELALNPYFGDYDDNTASLMATLLVDL